jgi:heat shock protein HslJ
MNKKNIYIIIAILVLFLAGFLYFKNINNKNPENSGITTNGEEVVIKDVKPGDLDQNTADPVLTGKQWEWREAYINEGDKIINPVDSKDFILSFVKGYKFSTTTDCNKLMGTYVLGEKSLKMKDIASTRMACEDPYAQELTYSSMLATADSYFFRDDGSLIIMMEEDKGTMTFAPISETE